MKIGIFGTHFGSINYKFKTESDTEVILHGYEKWGHDIVKKLRGMFAFCIYDKNKKYFSIIE